MVEERTPEEMPEYVSNFHIKDGYHRLGEHKVWKVLSVNLEDKYNPEIEINEDDEKYPASYFIPSTREQYSAYVKSKNNLAGI